jgi:hypothetical protein
MMTTSIDVYSQTNPAFLGIVLYQFVLGYEKASDDYPDYPLLFLPCPIVVSKRLARTMNGTNASTGLAKWYLQSPEVQITLADEVLHTVRFTRRAIQFDLLSKVLEIHDSAIVPVEGAFKKKPMDIANTTIENRPFAAANRFGQWCGQIHSTKRIFALLGLRP